MLLPAIVSATDLLYLICSALLLVSAAVVVVRDPRSALHRRYSLTALSLLGWVATLALYYRSSDPVAVLWLGRINFAAAALAVAFGYLLVLALGSSAAIGGNGNGQRLNRFLSNLPQLVVTEALLLAAASTFTGLIDKEEIVGAGPGGRHVTIYGALFLLYALHILGYIGASAVAAFQARRSQEQGPVRDRLTLVGAGVLATGIVGIVTDIILPYGFADFRFTDFGPLSTALFLLAVGYAVLKHRLFDLRLFVRRSLVFGLLLVFVAAAYSATIALITERLTAGGADLFTKFCILLIASSFDPLRRLLEHRVDKLLFREEKHRSRQRHSIAAK